MANMYGGWRKPEVFGCRKVQLNYGSDYLDLASYYKQNGNSELALQAVLEGLNKADGRLEV